MSLPSNWTEAIFSKLTLIYGRDFTGRWEGMNICDIKTDWSHELDGYDKRPKSIAWALDNLPQSKPPTVLEFRKLCNTMPQEATLLLPEPKSDPAFVAQVLAKITEAPLKIDDRDWARRIIARHAAGDVVLPCSLKCAQDALGISKKMTEAITGD